MGERKFFNNPIIRAKINRIRFPKSCPVCGRPATTTTWITTTPQKKRWLRPDWNPGFSPTRRNRFGLSPPEKKNFLIGVCDDHQISDDGVRKLRGLSIFFVTIVASTSIFVLMFAGSEFWAGNGIQLWVEEYFVVLIISIIIGYIAFRPNALESSVKIIGFDFDVQYVWLHLKNEEYRRKFLEENALSAELVTWIVKV